MKCTFSYLLIFTGLRLKIAVVGSRVFAFCPAILRRLSEKLEAITGVSIAIVLFPNIGLILFCHYFLALLSNPSSREKNQM